MKKSKTTTGILAIAFAALTVVSCKEAKKENNNADGHHSEMNHEATEDHDSEMAAKSGQEVSSNIIIDNYLQLKDALVNDSKNEAAKSGATMATALDGFDTSKFSSEEQANLKDIIETAKEHAEHIAKSEMDHQREHFKALSTDMMDMIAITGTPSTLYQQFCPMYDKGSAWLSTSKDIRNPYYGSKMLKCGKVEKTIN